MAKTSAKVKSTKVSPFFNLWKIMFLAIATIADSAFNHGYNLSSLTVLRKPLEQWLQELNYADNKTVKRKTIEPVFRAPTLISTLDSSFYIGGMIGSAFIIFYANSFGRRGGIIMASTMTVFAALLTGHSKYFNSVVLLFIGRLLYGIIHGLNVALAPMYLYEISPKGSNGQIGLLYGIFLSFGDFSARVLGLFLGNVNYWPLVQSICFIPSVITLAFLPLCPESPKFLYAIKGKELACKKALIWLRESKYQEEELVSIRGDYIQRQAIGKITLSHVLQNVILRQALILVCIITMSQQLCGISLIIVFVNGYLKRHYGHEANLKVLAGIYLNMAMTVIATIMFFIVPKFCRRKLYIVSFIGMSVTTLIICVLVSGPHFRFKYIIVFLSVFLYVCFYKVGPGILVWIFPSEIFSPAVAPIAYSLGLMLTWLLKTFMILYLKAFGKYLGGYGFLNYVISNALLAYYTYNRMPQTTDKSLKEIYKQIYEISKKNV